MDKEKGRLMPYCYVYIGDLEDSQFKWDLTSEEFGNGNVPAAISRVFPPIRGQFYGALGILMNKIDSGELSGKLVDWGCWVAVVTPAEITSFMNELYSKEWHESHAEGLNNFNARLEEVLSVVNKLDPTKKYALVGHELY
jgi:hypothetical protein